MDKTVTQIIEEVKNEMCDNYCKWLEDYLSKCEDPDDAHELMLIEKCGTCPLERL